MNSFGKFCAALIALAVVFGVTYWGINIKLINGDEAVKEAWGNIGVAEQRRGDLIPNLVKVVKGYAKHEKEVFTEVAEARASVGKIDISGVLGDADKMKQLAAAQAQMSSALTKLLAVAESYPQLKANQGFLDLQSQIEGAENRIGVARTRYNKAVRSQNSRIRAFSFISGGYEQYDSFEADEASKKVPEISFE